MKTQAQPHLVALSEGPNIALDKPIVLIGRHQECDIQIPSRKISRRHCCIALVDDHLVIRDLGSTNGIRINGIKVLEGNLQAEDEVTIGNMCYQVKWHAESEETVRGPENNGIKAGHPPIGKQRPHDESLDEPIPLPDVEQSHPPLPGKPAPQNPSNDAPAKPPALNIPANVGLAPLDPPG